MQKRNLKKSNQNKKILNATGITYEGIQFRSKFERDAYIELTKFIHDSSDVLQYETKPIKIFEGWKSSILKFIKGKWQHNDKIRDWTYTPDFELIHFNGNESQHIYIEIKGWGNDVLPYKRKVFLHWLEEFEKDAQYWEIYSLKELKEALMTLK